MKKMIIGSLVAFALAGCASNNDALKAQLDQSEAKNRELAAEIGNMKSDANTCQKVMFEAREAWAATKDAASKAYNWSKDVAAPVVEEKAGEAVEATKRWINKATTEDNKESKK